jgi:RNA polymerase sigma-70 factor (ECF subfamily)
MSASKTLRDPSEDKFWIKAALEGDPEAYGHLIQKYKDPLYDLACRILCNSTEAEDVLQEAFIEAYRHLADFHHKARFSTWIYSIVLNHVRNRLRHNKVLRWCSLDIPVSEDTAYRPPQVPESGPSFELLTEKKMEMDAIRRATKTLPSQYQDIFNLHYFEDLPLDEVAERLNRPIGTVKAYLHRARKLLYKQVTFDGEFVRSARNNQPKTKETVAV